MPECPMCETDTPQESLDQWSMCHDCDNQILEGEE